MATMHECKIFYFCALALEFVVIYPLCDTSLRMATRETETYMQEVYYVCKVLLYGYQHLLVSISGVPYLTS